MHHKWHIRTSKFEEYSVLIRVRDCDCYYNKAGSEFGAASSKKNEENKEEASREREKKKNKEKKINKLTFLARALE